MAEIVSEACGLGRIWIKTAELLHLATLVPIQILRKPPGNLADF